MNDDLFGCVAAVGVFAVIIAWWLLMPYICMIAWGVVAGAFGWPVFTYWQWFFLSWAIRWLFKPGIVKTKSND